MAVITITSDIGQDDFIIGAVKGQLLSAGSNFTIVDITHNLNADNYPMVAYVCTNTFKHYPKDTFHIILVDLFESKLNHLLVARYNNQYIACPNNGLITMITGNTNVDVVAVPLSGTNGVNTLSYSAAIANCLKQLVAGASLQQLGTSDFVLNEKYPARSTLGHNWIEGQIIHVDKFENVVVNITRQEFNSHRQGRNFHVLFSRKDGITSISRNYADVAPGEVVAWFNSADYLELAINRGKIAALFGLHGYSDAKFNEYKNELPTWLYTTVKIMFD